MVQLNEVFPIQQALDEEYIQQNNLQGVYTTHKKLIALYVELGEMANEIPWAFKYWSHKCLPRSEKIALHYASLYNQPVQLEVENPQLEEYVDMLHFILSVGNDLHVNIHTNFKPKNLGNVTEQLLLLAGEVGTLIKKVYVRNGYSESYKKMVELYLGLGELLDYSKEIMLDAYIKKNQVNYERIQAGY